ncbi:hypothetical protein ABFS82_01G031800 [Erythranthe guttata]|uniref:uncharacterized protein LOC105975205 isoform X1 n=1 Tax=Erythranthe guttata TaxID=4155 RepID=UPI00064D7F8F|nr:PREDICTED: uncharacterized protein LOC105975205 isoform X1 [Erythranthe guttata]|eukprot:XP_012855832.1 PREDICTED: uncharacterized protein LOC105975205 isoform X1 [Erythranthe guttata]
MIAKMGGGGGGVGIGGGGRVEVIAGKGCSRLFVDFSSSFRGIQPFSLEPLSPNSSAVSESPVKSVKSNGPFSGLVVCVTGLSKETRKQVKEATERLGGQYSPHLHPQCTHLVVESFHGRKFEHALKHGSTNGLFLVTISWFVDSVRKNVRLNETLYNANNIGDKSIPNDDLKRLDQNSGAENSCIPIGSFRERETKKQTGSSSLSGQTFYVDLDVPVELRNKVAEVLSAEGGSVVDEWFVGCNASHVVCEGPSIRKYLGHSSNIVTPLWIIKSAKEKSLQRLVHLSADLARYTGAMLDTFQHGVFREEVNRVTSSVNDPSSVIKASLEERRTRVNLAKEGVRKRRNRRMQTCQTPIRPITPSSLLDSICWSISESTSTASIYTESSSVEEENHTPVFFDGKESHTSFVNLSRPLTESEKSELIFKGNFLTIMFPVDRFSEMGPCSRTFFSNKGFTCLQVLDFIHTFYQENMSAEEIEIAIHTDSRHADRVRSAYSSKEKVEFKRIDFIGSRRSFEMLKRVSGDNNSNLYELLIRA